MKTVIVISAALFVTTSLFIKFWRHKRKPKQQPRMTQDLKSTDEWEWESAGKVSKLWIYPLKSCAGINIPSAEAQLQGLVVGNFLDRSFILASEKGTLIQARMKPSMVLIHPHIEDTLLTLKFSGVDDLTIDLSQFSEKKQESTCKVDNEEVIGFDCGEEASNWFQAVLNRKCHLLYTGDLPSLRTTKSLTEKLPLMKDDENSQNAGLTGFMLMTKASIADLQSRVNCPIAAQDFRPNILLEGTGNAYDEDNWEYIKIGGAIFRNVKPCERCIFTTINHETGKKEPHMEPLRTLRSYRCEGESKDPFFGIYLGLEKLGIVQEGDEVFVTRMVTKAK